MQVPASSATSPRSNVNRPFAIVLDDQVISAPVIREPILGGSGQISGSFTVETASQLAIQLRSGALPAKLTIVEERTVGPSLGADSVDAGKWAIMVGFLGVMVYMTVGYGLFGLFAMIALVVNLAFIIAALSLLQATLTLPGIAGIVLTMGMSVDANVLINERIRDELRVGKTPVAALDAGFMRAYGTIFDTNMTGLLGRGDPDLVRLRASPRLRNDPGHWHHCLCLHGHDGHALSDRGLAALDQPENSSDLRPTPMPRPWFKPIEFIPAGTKFSFVSHYKLALAETAILAVAHRHLADHPRP